jgi:hypothetical protein
VGEPVECTRQHEVVIDRQPVQSFCKISLIYQPTGLVNDDQGKDNPIFCQYFDPRIEENSYMMMS